jgi:hypothetical protein
LELTKNKWCEFSTRTADRPDPWTTYTLVLRDNKSYHRWVDIAVAVQPKTNSYIQMYGEEHFTLDGMNFYHMRYKGCGNSTIECMDRHVGAKLSSNRNKRIASIASSDDSWNTQRVWKYCQKTVNHWIKNGNEYLLFSPVTLINSFIHFVTFVFESKHTAPLVWTCRKSEVRQQINIASPCSIVDSKSGAKYKVTAGCSFCWNTLF